MRISATTVAAHRFGVVRRRGYDPAEVDATMERVSDTLHEYEMLTARLEEELRKKFEPTEALQRTFEAAERTKADMIAEGTAEAERLRKQAEADVASMVEQAWAESSKVRSQAEDEAAEIVGRAAHRLDVAEREAERRLLAAEHRSAEAQMAAEAWHEESRRALQEATVRAEAETENILTDARRRADALLATAGARERQLSDRLVALELAVADARRQLLTLGEAAIAAAEHVEDEDEDTAEGEDVTTIDLTAEEDEAGYEEDEAEAERRQDESMVVELAAHREAAFAAPDGSGMPPAERPTLDPDEVTSKHDGTSTHYQRAGGLRSRIEEVRAGD